MQCGRINDAIDIPAPSRVGEDPEVGRSSGHAAQRRRDFGRQRAVRFQRRREFLRGAQRALIRHEARRCAGYMVTFGIRLVRVNGLKRVTPLMSGWTLRLPPMPKLRTR